MYFNMTSTFGLSIQHTIFIFSIAIATVFFSFALMASTAVKDLGPEVVTLFFDWFGIYAIRPYLPTRYQIVGYGVVSGIQRRLQNRMSCTLPKGQTTIGLAKNGLQGSLT